MSKSVVAVRKEGNQYLAYFLEQRITIYVSEVGAKILVKFLNEDMSVNDIATDLVGEYRDSNYLQVLSDTKTFLAEIYKGLSTTNVNEAENDFLDRPLGVEIEITTACNLRCKHCFQGEYPEKYMTLDRFVEIVNILVENNIYEIHLVGGEIFKHPDIIKMLKYLDSKNVSVTIVTNAIGIGDEEMKILKEMKRLYVLVSIDGTRELHDKIRGIGVFDKVIPKIKYMNKNGIKVELLCTMNGINVDHADEITKMAKSLGVPINFNLFKPFNKAQEFLTVKPEDFFDTVEMLLDMRKNGYQVGISDASIAAEALGLPEKNECTATMSGMVITTDGKMITCPYLLEAGYYTAKELPDFDENFISEWKNGKMFSKFRENGQKGCQARSLIFSGDVQKGDPYDLNSYRKYKQGASF